MLWIKGIHLYLDNQSVSPLKVLVCEFVTQSWLDSTLCEFVTQSWLSILDSTLYEFVGN
jgi:hypothetical protein